MARKKVYLSKQQVFQFNLRMAVLTLFVRGLIPGDKITVYAPTGHLIYQATASHTEWTLPLYYQNGYIVRVNDRPYKVLNL